MRLLKLLVAASAVLLFLGLDASTIWDANEAFYAETPRQMVQSGDYVNPSFNGAPRFNKPVLNYWIVAAFYNVLGVSIWTERVAIAIALPALAFVVYLAWQRRLGDILRMHLPAGALIVIAIVAPWYGMVYAEHGWDYIRDFFIGENLGRYAETYGQQSRPFYFYLPVLFTELFPWSLFLPAALWMAWKWSPQSTLARLLLVWIATIVLVFTFSSTKQDLYIFPIVAALAALIAGTLDRWIDGKEHRALFPATWLVIGLALIGMWGVLARLFGDPGSPYYIRGAFAAGMVLLSGYLTAVTFLGRRRRLSAVIALGVTLAVANYILVLRALPDFERFKPVAPLSAAALQRNPDAHVVQFRTPLPSMVWYLGKPVEEVYDEPILVERLSRGGETLVLLTDRDYEHVRTFAPETCVVAKHTLMDVKLREILAGTALPEMLLISNRCGN